MSDSSHYQRCANQRCREPATATPTIVVLFDDRTMELQLCHSCGRALGYIETAAHNREFEDWPDVG